MLLAMAEYREQVGSRIRELRLAKGLTQDQLADLVGVREKTISRWESGKHSGYIRNLNAVAEALEVDAKEITGTPPAPLGLGVQDERKAQMDRIEQKLDRVLRALGQESDESAGFEVPTVPQELRDSLTQQPAARRQVADTRPMQGSADQDA